MTGGRRDRGIPDVQCSGHRHIIQYIVLIGSTQIGGFRFPPGLIFYGERYGLPRRFLIFFQRQITRQIKIFRHLVSVERKKTAFTILSETVSEELILEEDALNRLSASEIFNLIVQLPVGYRTIFNLHCVEGIPHSEIAVLLRIAEGTSKSQLSKARTLLQKMLLQKKIEYVTRKTR